MFKRREKRHPISVARETVWPRRGWGRAARYLGKRTLRIKATPHAIAAGFAAGVFASFTPFMGLHFLLSFALAWLIGGSLIAAAFGTAIGNPLTFPFIWATTYRFGSAILGEDTPRPSIELSDGLFSGSFEVLWPLLKPMVVGGSVIGLLSALVFYFPVRYAVAAYQRRRAERRRAADAQNTATW